jgi:hypothetical protein
MLMQGASQIFGDEGVQIQQPVDRVRDQPNKTELEKREENIFPGNKINKRDACLQRDSLCRLRCDSADDD